MFVLFNKNMDSVTFVYFDVYTDSEKKIKCNINLCFFVMWLMTWSYLIYSPQHCISCDLYYATKVKIMYANMIKMF